MKFESKQDSLLPLSTLAVLLAAIGGAMMVQSRLQTFRPAEEPASFLETHAQEDVAARSWQDPFGALRDFHQLRAQAGSEELEAGARLRRLGQQLRGELRDWGAAQPAQGASEPGLTILLGMLPGGRFAENIETRRRTRYAVLTALAVEGLVPVSREHIGYFETRWDEHSWLLPRAQPPTPESAPESTPEPPATEAHPAAPIEIDVPFEWFRADELRHASDYRARGRVLVLWLDEDAGFAVDPFKRLDQLMSRLIHASLPAGAPCPDEDPSSIAVKLLGPSGSNTLLNMMQDGWRAQGAGEREARLAQGEPASPASPTSARTCRCWSLERLDIYNSRATAPAPYLRVACGAPRAEPQTPTPRSDEGAAAPGPEPFRDPVADWIEAACGAHYHRVVCSDDELFWALAYELKLRRVDLRDADSQIALVAEMDTFYGRAMPQALRAIAESELSIDSIPDPRHDQAARQRALDDSLARHTEQHAERTRERIHVFSYLRGLDGIIPRADGKQSETASRSETEGWQHPVGPSQLDYIRRLAAELKRRDAVLRADHQRGFEAIGVVGTDVYDKQLILQALHDGFPEAQLFTTDLDARLLHASQYPWSRNLVVASAFGLELNEEIQDKAPPFRDSYQTASYLATRLALGWSCAGLHQAESTAAWHESHLEPRLFEVARTGAYDLSATRSSRGLHLPAAQRPKSEILMWAAILGAAGLLYAHTSRARMRLRDLAASLEHDYWEAGIFWVSLITWAMLFLLTQLLSGQLPDTDEPVALIDGISVWPTVALQILVIGISLLGILFGRMCIRANDGELERRFRLSSTPAKDGWAEIRGAFAYSCGLAASAATQQQPRGEREPQPVDALQAWNDYRQSGGAARTAWRVAFRVGCYGVASLGLLMLLGGSQAPARGPSAWWISTLVEAASWLSLSCLLFYVVDITRECAQFIHTLSATTTRWPAAVANGQRVPADDLANLLDVQLIAARTKVVGGLIVVPFVAIFLTIVSRLKVFDDWDWPLALILILGVQALISLSAAVHLRRTAEHARGMSLQRLDERRLEELGLDTPRSKALLPQLETLLEAVRGMRQGAFSPWFQHPIVRAVLMPFGGIGLLTAIDALVKGGL